MSPVKMSVVVPAYNEEKLITASLRSIQSASTAFTQLSWETEIVVCDNNSADHTAELARAQEARVVTEPINQISRARNTGAAATTGDWLLFVDADSFPTRELFADVAQEIRKGNCLGGGATVRLDQAPFTTRLVAGAWNLISRSQHWVAGSFSFCKTPIFRELGGFSEQLFVSEEIEFSQRLKALARRAGKRVVILHRHPLTTSARKIHLYSTWEHLRFVARAIRTRGRAFQDRSACTPWYDGRR
jgi:glycosyltransferase involved in cell wall biosynthesis